MVASLASYLSVAVKVTVIVAVPALNKVISPVVSSIAITGSFPSSAFTKYFIFPFASSAFFTSIVGIFSVVNKTSFSLNVIIGVACVALLIVISSFAFFPA